MPLTLHLVVICVYIYMSMSMYMYTLRHTVRPHPRGDVRPLRRPDGGGARLLQRLRRLLQLLPGANGTSRARKIAQFRFVFHLTSVAARRALVAAVPFAAARTMNMGGALKSKMHSRKQNASKMHCRMPCANAMTIIVREIFLQVKFVRTLPFPV